MKRVQVRKGAPWDMQDERGFLLKVGAWTAASQQLQGVCCVLCTDHGGEFEYLPDLMCCAFPRSSA